MYACMTGVWMRRNTLAVLLASVALSKVRVFHLVNGGFICFTKSVNVCFSVVKIQPNAGKKDSHPENFSGHLTKKLRWIYALIKVGLRCNQT